MAIDHNCRTTGPMFIAGPDDGMTFRRYKLRLQANPVELVHQPVCTLDQRFFVLVISRDAWKPQERIVLLEIIVADGGKLIGLCRLPTLSGETPCAQNRKLTTAPAQFHSRRIPESWRERESKRWR